MKAPFGMLATRQAPPGLKMFWIGPLQLPARWLMRMFEPQDHPVAASQVHAHAAEPGS